MSELIRYEDVEAKVLSVRGQQVIVDRDVAELYGVETKAVNQAVRNNPDKFPAGYIISLESAEWDSLRSKIFTLNESGRGQHTKYTPRAFTEKGLYMLASEKVHFEPFHSGTAARLADEYNVSRSTIKRDAVVANACEKYSVNFA